jgi:hypothetical protein
VRALLSSQRGRFLRKPGPRLRRAAGPLRRVLWSHDRDPSAHGAGCGVVLAIDGVSRISRNRCQASTETPSSINRRRSGKHQPKQYTADVAAAADVGLLAHEYRMNRMSSGR